MTMAEASTTIAVGQNGSPGMRLCRIMAHTETTLAPKNSPTSSSATRNTTGKRRPPAVDMCDISERSPLICTRATASESTNLSRMPTVNTQIRASPCSAPEFSVVIMSEAPTLDSARTIPGPIRRSLPRVVRGACRGSCGAAAEGGMVMALSWASASRAFSP